MKNENLWWEISDNFFSMSDVTEFLYDSRAGGVDIFVGVTREWTGDKQTIRLSYECYKPMALKEMKSLLDEASRRWPVVKACMLHRVGVVSAAQPSVIIGVSTPHRRDSFEACRFLIDTLKIHVPIWKKESFADGTEEWVDPTGEASENP